MPVNVVAADTQDWQRLMTRIRNQRPVLLVGSAVSAWSPTSLPVGASFGEDMFHFLYGSDTVAMPSALAETLRDLVEAAPFEHLLERCPEHIRMRRIIRQVFCVRTPNPIHRALARGLADGVLGGIVTTNYDLCLDDLLTGDAAVRRVVTQDDAASIGQSTPVLFKIHGSADDADGDTLVWALRYESRLPRWKRSLLARMVDGRPLLVVGYSGRDFELCPELAILRPAPIVWNVTQTAWLSGRVTPNSQRVMESTGGTYLVGDMRVVLRDLLEPVDASWGVGSTALMDLVRSSFNSCEVAVWQADLASALGMPVLGLRAAERIARHCGEGDRWRALRATAQALFHKGRYRDAAARYRAAAETDVDSATRLALQLEEVDATRCRGNLGRATRLVDEVESQLLDMAIASESLQAWADWKRVQILRDRHRIAVALRMRRRATRLHREIRPLLRRSAGRFLENGNWWSFNSASLWAERLGIDLTADGNEDFFSPPPALNGAQHLGNWVAESMAARERSYAKEPFEPPQDEVQQLDRLLALASALDCHPERWKLARLRMRTGPLRSRVNAGRLLMCSLWRCQYTLLQRLVSLVLGGQ